MAFDRLLMELVRSGKWDIVLRTYLWKPACVSIGKLQRTSREVNADKLLSDGFGLVRRPTGGRAVWHETELTYSITAPVDHPAVSGSISQALRKTSAPMLRAIEALGIEAQSSPAEVHRAGGPRVPANPCFTSHGLWEIGTPDGRKLVGSAQARSRGVFLEHGSILLENDQTRILDYLPDHVPAGVLHRLREHLSGGIASLREFRPGLEASDVRESLKSAFSASLGCQLPDIPFQELMGARLDSLESECARDL